MTPEERALGRDQVRTVLIARCEEAGLTRPAKRSAEEHRQALAKLADRIAYMAPDTLATLADVLIRNAQVKRGVALWPSEAVVLHLAKGLQEPPVEEPDIVGSWFASRQGPQILAGGYEVELLYFLRRRGVPPQAADLARLRAEAAENRREMERIGRACMDGTATEADRASLEGYMASRDYARAIIERGKAKRKAQANEGAG